MSQLTHGAYDAANLWWLGSALTVTFFSIFAGWSLWVFRPANRTSMEAAAHMPFDGEES